MFASTCFVCAKAITQKAALGAVKSLQSSRPLLLRASLPLQTGLIRFQRLSTMTETTDSLNVLGTALRCCCNTPKTGFYRDGYCRTGPMDRGSHTVCAVVSEEFLQYSRSLGNDLMTPVPMYQFPGLQPGDKWCLCVSRWKQALDADCAPPVILEACHEKSLEVVKLDELRAHQFDPSSELANDESQSTSTDVNRFGWPEADARGCGL